MCREREDRGKTREAQVIRVDKGEGRKKLTAAKGMGNVMRGFW